MPFGAFQLLQDIPLGVKRAPPGIHKAADAEAGSRCSFLPLWSMAVVMVGVVMVTVIAVAAVMMCMIMVAVLMSLVLDAIVSMTLLVIMLMQMACMLCRRLAVGCSGVVMTL